MTSEEHKIGRTNGDVPDSAAAAPFRVATVAVGSAMMAADQVRDGVRSVRGRTVSVALGFLEMARDQMDQARTRVRATVDEADRRGRGSLAVRRQDAASLVDTTVNGAVSWAQVKVMPQLVDDLVSR
jgi:hypothetical protein